ncbi:MAG: (Fe-S)-binding protein [Rhodothermales bacterium]
MTVGLFIPCYIDQFFPHVGVATLELLERLDCEVVYPRDQTCCGQPMSNAGFMDEAEAAHRNFIEQFSGFDYVVAPSGSCVLHVREHVRAAEAAPHGSDSVDAAATHAGADAGEADDDPGGRTYELCQFLIEVLQVDRVNASFPHRVGLHAACHGLRGLRLASSSERQDPPFNYVAQLLGMVDGLELVELERPDECCGFGGTFSVSEEAVSVRMGRDRVADHVRSGAEVIVSTDISCLMHMDGLIRREGRPVRVAHVAEILNGTANAGRTEKGGEPGGTESGDAESGDTEPWGTKPGGTR